MADCAGEYRRSFVAERMQQANHLSAEWTDFPHDALESAPGQARKLPTSHECRGMPALSGHSVSFREVPGTGLPRRIHRQ
jgi:hypothetical protein